MLTWLASQGGGVFIWSSDYGIGVATFEGCKIHDNTARDEVCACPTELLTACSFVGSTDDLCTDDLTSLPVRRPQTFIIWAWYQSPQATLEPALCLLLAARQPTCCPRRLATGWGLQLCARSGGSGTQHRNVSQAGGAPVAEPRSTQGAPGTSRTIPTPATHLVRACLPPLTSLANGALPHT